MTNEQERAFEQIMYIVQQAQVPGNDWRRELKLIESTCRAALQSQEQPITYAGISYWVGDKRCSYGFTKDELELSTLDIIQASLDHARRRIEGEKK